MELLFLGTGAGELWPSPFCSCESCSRGMHGAGDAIRIGSCLMVDRRFLFDLPPNLGLAAVQRGVSLAAVTHLFVTHSHQDHFDPCVLAATRRDDAPPLEIFCPERLCQLLPSYQHFNRFFSPEKLHLIFRVVRPGEGIRDPDAGFTLVPLPADHDTTGGEIPLIYILTCHEKTILYACDTGLLPQPAWEEIGRWQFDAVVLECTGHEIHDLSRGHLGLSAFMETRDRFASGGLLKQGARFIAQHVGHRHSGDDLSHGAVRERLRALDVDLAHDGMIVDV